jgi:hypothetical protein
MADSITTTNGNIYTTDGSVAAIKEAEYDLATQIHANADQVKDRVVEDFIATETNANNRSNVLKDRVTDNFIAQTSQARNDFVAATAQANQIAQTQTLADTLSTQNLTAQANQIAATETLASSLNYTNSTAQANDIGRQLTNIATVNATNAAAQADRVAQAAVIQVERVATAGVIANTLASHQDAAQAERLAAATGAQIAIAATEARMAAQAAVIAGFHTNALVVAESAKTRELMNQHYSDELRDKINLQHQELVELKFDNKNRDRDYANLNNNFLQSQMSSQLNAINSNIAAYHQTASQKNVSFGAGAVTGGATSNQVA